MTTFHYIYFSEDDSVIGAGTFIGDKEGLAKEINGVIKQVSDTGKFMTIVSDTIDFLTEAKEYDDVKEYLKSVVKRIKFTEVE